MRKKLSLFFLVIVLLDQTTKWLAVKYLSDNQSIPVIPGFFNFTLVYNPGAAFGMFSMWPDALRRTSLAIVSIIALIIVVRFMAKEAKEDLISQIALVGVLSGAIGNIIDRVRLDRVIDFLDFYWNNLHWPAFNVADSAISVGVVVLIGRMLFAEKPAEQKDMSVSSSS